MMKKIALREFAITKLRLTSPNLGLPSWTNLVKLQFVLLPMISVTQFDKHFIIIMRLEEADRLVC